MNVVRGWAFPKADRFMVGELKVDGTYQLGHLEAALTHVTNFDAAIDGGAHVGTWTRVLAGRFRRVVSFEPSEDTYECLLWNIRQAGLTNVQCVNAALGAAAGHVSMALDAVNAARANTGARFTQPGGPIAVVTIDSLAREDVGFLKLDIEGSEPAALRGAAETIARCRPIVLFENKKLWTRHFGLPKDAVARILTGYGYRQLQVVSCDEIWGPS